MSSNSSKPVIVFDNVSKLYRLGTGHDSLRDAIPALLKKLAGRNGADPHHHSSNEFWALKDVSFQVHKGETVGIVGPNGAGKSTILKMLSKIIRPTKGDISVSGRLAALIELGGGFHPDLTGSENIYLQGTMLGFSRREIAKLYDSIVAFSEIEKFLQTPVKRYSSGMVVRLGFAIAAHVSPEVLLIDEVLAVGDLSFQQKCFKRIDELKKEGTTIVFISHNLEAVQKLCDRAILLRGGRVFDQGETSEMVRRYRDDIFSGMLKQTAGEIAHSDGTFKINSVLLLDADGKEVETIETARPLNIEISYETKRQIRHPSVRVSIERMDGLVCHTTNSRQNGLEVGELNGEGTVTLQYLSVNLLPNLYQVSVDVYEEDNLVPLASVRQHRLFQITSSFPEEYGAVHLDHEWSLSALPQLSSGVKR